LSSDWSEEQHYYVAVDTQPPIITFVSPVGGERYIVGISSIIINYMVTDNLDVEPKHYAYLTHLEKGTTIPVSIGEIIDPVSIDAGFWTLTVVAVDSTGNSVSSTTAKFEVIHDILPPRTNVEFREPRYERSDLVYVTKETQFVLSSVDDLVVVNDNKGFGVKIVSYKLDGDWVTVLNSQPQVGQVFVTTFVPVGYNDGLYTFSYFAEDVVGNNEVVKSTSVAIDNTAPKTSIVVYEPKYETSDELPQWYSIRYKTYISPKTFIGFTSEDPVVNGVSCGVRLTKYRIDKTTWVAFIEVYIPQENVWRSSFTLSEGIKEIDYYSVDNLGNEEKPFNTAKLFVDGTAPESTLSVEGSLYRSDNLYVGSQTKFKLSCVDPVVKDVSSGVESVYWKTDLDPDFIKKETPIEDYELPISFPEGIHKIVYQSVDRVKNIEELKELVVYVDTTSPQTEVIISEPKFNNFVTSSTFISLLAKDPVSSGVYSGVKFTRYRIDNGGWMVSTTEFNLTGLSEGTHTIEYYSEDNVGNTEDIKSLSLIIDNTAPLTTLCVGTPQYSYATNLWVSKYTLFTFTAVDLGEIPSGVSYTEYKIDDGVWQRYVDPFDLSSYSEGEHKIYYRSSDNLGNLEQEKSLSVIIDDSPPETSVTITQPRYNEYVTSASKFVLSSIDSGLTPCGVQYTKYRIIPPSDSLFTVYDSTFNISGPDGVYTIEYYSVDNVGNTEIIKSTTVKLDNTPPISRLELQGVKYISEDKTYIRPDTQIVVLSEDPVVNDVASGVKFILYSIDGASFDVYSSPFTLEEGVHTIKYYSVDQLGNFELINSITLYVDATAPLSVLVIGGPKCDEQKYPYTVISSKTSLTLLATDPVIKDVSSGVKETRYKVSSISGIISDWDLYKGSFTIVSADGDYLIEYYSIDNVLNTELIKSSTVTLDKTAPFVELLSPIPQSAGFEQLLNGVVEIIGSVKDLHFSWYEVSYAQAGSDEFITIAKEYKEVAKDVLAVWDTTNLVNGYYTLRVTAVDCVGNKTVVETEVYVGQAEVVLEFGGIGKEVGKFNSPSYICIDTSSNVWISDTNNDRIQVFDKNGKFLKEITGYEIKSSGNSQGKGQNKKQYSYFNKPTGISVDKEGNIYIADRNNDRIVKLDSEGKFVFELKGFNKPHSLVLDDIGNIYVADRNNNRIQKFSPAGELLMTITTAVEYSLNKPQGVIVVDSLGRIYVTDRNNNRVLVYSSTGVYLCEISSLSGLNKPDGIYVSNTGFVYVCDSNNDRVVGFNNLFFKMFEIIGFNKPSGVIMDNECKLWVVDTNNGKIRVYSIPERHSVTTKSFMSASVLRSPDNFMFGNVYSYPNPAKQTNPTIHIECGIADKIDIKIYNIAGELVHKTTLTGPPKLIRGKLAYEYEWDVKNVASGVYIYYIYAEKSGEEPIKVLKKLAIIK
jgi:sugar lactone lactonase YvrE